MLKKNTLINISLVLIVFTSACFAQKTSADVHHKTNINKEWKFFNADIPSGETINLNDDDWTEINLPHTWNAEELNQKSNEYRRGIGWYRKHFFIKKEYYGKKLFLKFEAANQVAEVFVNGKLAGKHIGGYTAFTFDITDLVQLNEENVIAVKVDNSHNANIPPLSADFIFYGGIYRDVWLIAVEPVHFSLTDYSSNGIYISTPLVNEGIATVKIKGVLNNSESSLANVKIINRILDRNNNVILTTEGTQAILSNSKLEFNTGELIIKNPNFWSPENPYLYTVSSEIYLDGKIVDRVLNPLGFRWFTVDGQKGFFLNGKRINLYGTNRHQDQANIGNALTNSQHKRDVQIIKDNGFNFLRLAHYPQDETVLQTCDSLGIIVWEEIPIVNNIAVSKEFENNSKQMLREMIKQHYNHPSVFLWGYMNEITLIIPSPTPPNYVDSIVSLEKKLESIVNDEDPYRLSVIAQFPREIDTEPEIGEVTDVVGFNLYNGWYYNNFENFGKYIDDFHEEHPRRPIIISEYGAGNDERIHTDSPIRFDFSTEYAQLFHESHFNQIKQRSYLTGSAVWNQFDFGSKSRHDTKSGINQKGLYYFDRTPKDISYYYKASLLKKPVVHIASDDYKIWGITNNLENKRVKVYSNAEEVKLTVNNSVIGSIKPVNNISVFIVPVKPGKNFIEAEGKFNDQLVVDTITTLAFMPKIESIGDSILINVGAHYSYSTGADNYWFGQNVKNKNLWFFDGGENKQSQHVIYNTEDDPLFQTSLEDVDEFAIPVVEGSYLITLGFCENIYSEPNERVFDVFINGKKVFNKLDLISEAGKFTALYKTTTVEMKKAGKVVIKFDAVEEESTLSLLKIKKIK